MSRNVFLSLSLILFISRSLPAFEVVIAPLKIYTLERERASGREISAMIAQDNKYVIARPALSEAVMNIMEASSLCDREGYDNLIFGFLTADDVKCSMELKFYSHRTRSVETTFFASDAINQIERLSAEISEKIFTYIDRDSGYYKQEPEKVFQPGIFSIPVTLGYWVPLESERRDYSTSIICAGSGIQVDPFENLHKWENLALEFRFGFSVLYELSINDPDYETFYLHKTNFFIPVELGLLITGKHSFSISAAPFIQMDILDLRKNYQEPETAVSAAFGFSAGIAYNYIFTDFFRFGLSCSFDFVFYDPLQVTFRPGISVLFNLGSLVIEESAE
ncbi:MAG: hypothetical protein JXR86_17210 [Spirochaetales bacterium]|nr:hypothetical protein [Spirochaetales bacterium]